MPDYCLTALEKFLVKTVYYVSAATPEQAEQLCKDGEVAYEQVTIEEGDDEWVDTILIEEE
jgi:hypothetical protein